MLGDVEIERWRDEVKNISARSAYFYHDNIICDIMFTADRSARKKS